MDWKIVFYKKKSGEYVRGSDDCEKYEGDLLDISGGFDGGHDFILMKTRVFRRLFFYFDLTHMHTHVTM